MKLLNLYRANESFITVIPFAYSERATLYVSPYLVVGIKTFNRSLEDMQRSIDKGIHKKVKRSIQ